MRNWRNWRCKMIGVNDTDIQKILNEVVIASKGTLNGGLPDLEWTRRIKNSLVDLADNNNYDVTANSCNAKDEEWLFDMTFGETQDDQFLDMPFAMESEWSRNQSEIDKDFEKLLVAKARLKLFIFQKGGKDEIIKEIERLKGKIDMFKIRFPGERYMLAGYSINDNEFFYGRVTL
jgi:hypothetical protein